MIGRECTGLRYEMIGGGCRSGRNFKSPWHPLSKGGALAVRCQLVCFCFGLCFAGACLSHLGFALQKFGFPLWQSGIEGDLLAVAIATRVKPALGVLPHPPFATLRALTDSRKCQPTNHSPTAFAPSFFHSWPRWNLPACRSTAPCRCCILPKRGRSGWFRWSRCSNAMISLWPVSEAGCLPGSRHG